VATGENDLSGNGLPTAARAVVIGAGIAGNCLVYHLARLGWKDLVLLDKGPLPNPGGSTGHASNFIFPVDHSKEMTSLTRDSARQYEELGVLTISGGVEVARTEARLEELRRRMSSAASWGEPDCELIDPDRVVELVPYINKDVILGGFHTPGVSVVDSLRAGTLMREYAQEKDALSVSASTEVTGIDVENGRVRRVHTDKGDIDTEYLFIACGVWSPRIARMAGATIPLTPAVHQMISVGPIPLFAETSGEIEYPIVRDVDTNMYERQNGSDMEVGSYAHRAILMDPDDIPSIEQSALSPTELPFTSEDFDPQMEDALELMPEILTAEGAGIRHAINGLLSLTADGMPLLGETEVGHVWSVSALWIKEAAGIARAVAEWVTDGASEIDLHGADVSRFYDYQRTKRHVDARSDEGFNRTYGIVHPMEQWLSNRRVRLSPFYAREEELGAVFYETAGWERPWWYESNKGLLEEYGDRVMPREAEWESRWWSPIINAEHLAMRDRVAMIDLSAFAIFDVVGSGSVDYLQRVALAEVDVEVGRVIYTPILNHEACFKSDLTIMRLGEHHFRVVTGGMDGPRDMKWFGDLLPEDGSATLLDTTSAWCTVGVWGPRARDLVSSLTSADVSHEGFPFARCRWIELGPVRTLASRISYVGELGWELYAPMEQGRALWELLWEAGQPLGVVPAGIGVYGTTGRIEKGYRLYGAELESEYNVVEAGMARPTVKEADFVGKEAHLRHRDEEPAAILCTLTVDDPTSSSGVKRYMLGREPILTLDGERIVDSKGRSSYVTSAGSAPSLGTHLLLAYLPPEHAQEGRKLQVQYMSERYPVTVAVAGARSLFDPENTRVRC
jgi:glycine cleavage system aminomethyltransferase T/glycine/D-amino acid oxidase-like deaminating enzyme